MTRTHDLLITNRIRCKNLGKTGLFSPFLAVESSGQHSFPERRHTRIFWYGSERGSAEGEDKISCTSYFLRRINKEIRFAGEREDTKSSIEGLTPNGQLRINSDAQNRWFAK